MLAWWRGRMEHTIVPITIPTSIINFGEKSSRCQSSGWVTEDTELPWFRLARSSVGRPSSRVGVVCYFESLVLDCTSDKSFVLSVEEWNNLLKGKKRKEKRRKRKKKMPEIRHTIGKSRTIWFHAMQNQIQKMKLSKPHRVGSASTVWFLYESSCFFVVLLRGVGKQVVIGVMAEGRQTLGALPKRFQVLS